MRPDAKTVCTEKSLDELIKELEYAKKAVQSTLDNADCSVDFHGLEYWAGKVERLRKEIKSKL